MYCPICKTPTIEHSNVDRRDAVYFNCYRCGKFQLTGTTEVIMQPDMMTSSQVANMSGWIREHQLEIIGSNDYERLLKLTSPTVPEKANKLMNYLSRTYPIAGQTINFTLKNLNSLLNSISKNENVGEFIKIYLSTLPLLSSSWTHDETELKYLIHDYLEKEKGYLSFDGYPRISPKGWAFLENKRFPQIESDSCFVAMWFDPSMDEIWYILKDSIIAAGYNPIRVDKHHHVNRIDDEIISLIRKSKFIVADYTGQRPGVYFESGFTLGLGRNVFWLCENTERKKLHFDTNHYNFILWDRKKLDVMSRNLTIRISSIEGTGNYSLDSE